MMSTTLLERTDPTFELRARPTREAGISHSILAELDQVEQALDPDWKPITGSRERMRRALGALKRPIPAPQPKPAPAAAPNPSSQPITRTAPTEEPKPIVLSAPPRIRPILHHAGRWAVHQLPPIPLLWRPMLRRVGPHILADDTWRAFWGHWDVFLDATHRSVCGRLELLRRGADMRLSATREKMQRITEFHVRGAWEDYLSTFGALQDSISTRIADELERLDVLSL